MNMTPLDTQIIRDQPRWYATRPDRTQRHRSRRNRFARRVSYALLTILGVAMVAAAMQSVAERRDQARHVPPGDLVELSDGRHVHLNITGLEHDGPTVILETGMGGFSAGWGWIQPAVAEHATVVSYDRAGLGWSDPSPHEPTADAVVSDLREALRIRGIGGPYVLVGHSLGGLYVRAFAAEHPNDTAGLVLVDPSHEHQHIELGQEFVDSMAQTDRLLAVIQAVSRIGLTRLYDPFAPMISDLPEPELRAALAAQVTPRYYKAYRAEAAAMNTVAEHVAALGDDLGDVPLRVIAATAAGDPAYQETVDTMTDLRSELVRLSTDASLEIMEAADHLTIVTAQEHASEVSQVIIDLLEGLR